MVLHFHDRETAGKLLAYALQPYCDNPNVVVYALPRGGVILGIEVARALRVPLGLVIARKIGHPQNEEFAIGAVTETGEPIIEPPAMPLMDPAWLTGAINKARQEAARRRERYGQGSRLSAENKIAIVVDDGVATGLTLRAALRELRQQRPKQIIVAVPVAPASVIKELEREADEVIALDPGRDFVGSVGAYYDDFPQVSDEQVIEVLKAADESL